MAAAFPHVEIVVVIAAKRHTVDQGRGFGIDNAAAPPEARAGRDFVMPCIATRNLRGRMAQCAKRHRECVKHRVLRRANHARVVIMPRIRDERREREKEIVACGAHDRSQV